MPYYFDCEIPSDSFNADSKWYSARMKTLRWDKNTTSNTSPRHSAAPGRAETESGDSAFLIWAFPLSTPNWQWQKLGRIAIWRRSISWTWKDTNIKIF